MTNAELQAFARQFSSTSGQFNEDLSAALTVCGVPEGRQIIERLNALFRVPGANSWQLALTYGLPSLWLDFTLGGALDPRITFSRASAATRVNASGLIESISSGQPRFDFDPVALTCKGLLVEEQRTNLVTRSQEFDNGSAWLIGRASVSANSTTSPDGTVTADKLVEGTQTGAHYLYGNNIPVSANTVHTWSIFVKAAERSTGRLEVTDGGGSNGFRCYFDLAAGGTIGTNAAMGTGTVSESRIEALPNGWYRISVSGVIDAASTMADVLLYLDNNTDTSSIHYTGDGTSGLYIWGAQLEAGSNATSYIPTTTSQATRAADVAVINGLATADWFNAAEGTVVVAAIMPNAVPASAVLAAIFEIGDGGYNNRLLAYQDTSNNLIGGVTTGGVSQAAMNAGSYTPGNATRIALAYKVNDFAAARNGGAVATDASGTVPSVTTLGLGKQIVGGGVLNGYIKRLTYYPRRLSDAQLQAFTS